jgi:hypothetical protein
VGENDGDSSKPTPEKPERKKTIEEIFDEGTEIDAALERAVREAWIRHKKLGQSIVVWQEGKVVTLPPDQIPI